MSSSTPPTYKTKNWPAYNEALKRRGSLTIWLDPEMTWDAAPTGRRGGQQTYSDAAIQTCLSMKVLFGMALRQTTGLVESLLKLIGLNWAVPDFSALSRRQKTLAVNIPYHGSKGPLHLLIPSRDIASQCTAAQWTALASRSRVKASGMRASIPVPNRGFGAKSSSGSTSKRWRSELSSSPAVASAVPPCCRNCSIRSHPDRRSVASPQTAPATRASAMMPLRIEALPPSFPQGSARSELN